MVILQLQKMKKFNSNQEQKFSRRNFLKSGMILSSSAVLAGLESCKGEQNREADYLANKALR